VTEPVHNADCYTEIVRLDREGYYELTWTCVDECKVGKK
jgi:hypothetical protein